MSSGTIASCCINCPLHLHIISYMNGNLASEAVHIASPTGAHRVAGQNEEFSVSIYSYDTCDVCKDSTKPRWVIDGWKPP